MMENKIYDFIKSEYLLEGGDHVIVALSGGADSVALLHLLNHLKETMAFSLSAIHIHHGIRQASDKEQTFVEDLCGQLEVPVATSRVDLSDLCDQGMSLEMAARQARYKVFDEALKVPRTLIALGHHMDDQAETLLLNLFRGAGLQGLKGMLPRRGAYIRPLLAVSKEDILSYCHYHDLAYVTDESNMDIVYRRNYIRHELIPSIEAHLQSGLKETLWRTSQLARDDQALLEVVTAKAYEGLLFEEGDRSVQLDGSQFRTHEKALQRRILRHAIKRISGNLDNISYQQIEDGIGLIAKGQTGKLITLSQAMLIRLDYDKIHVEKRSISESFYQALEVIELTDHEDEKYWVVGPLRLRIFSRERGVEFPKEVCTKWFDYDKIGTNLVLRTRRPGDWIRLNQKGYRKKLKDLMIDSKISREERDRIPVLGLESDNTHGQEVLWLVGYRINEVYKVSDTTSRVLEVVYIKEDLQ